MPVGKVLVQESGLPAEASGILASERKSARRRETGVGSLESGVGSQESGGVTDAA